MTAPPRLHDAPAVGPTLADLRRLVSPVTGLISAVRPMQSGLASSHAATAFCGFGGDATDLPSFKNSIISQGAGVGTTPEDAEFGAICEALERFSCLTMGDEPFVLAAYADLDPATTLRPEACLLYSERQYARRAEINQRGAAFDIVPEPFDEQARIAWTGVWSLSAGRFKLVPSTYLFYYFPQTSARYCWADSNGCAAGASIADAVVRGLLELVERDCVALWWYNRIRRPGLRLEVAGDEHLTGIADAYRGLGRDIWALDLTADLGIPTFAAISRRVDATPEDIVLGFGANLDPRRALRHAVLEMNHILPAVLPSTRTSDGDYSYPELAQKEWWRTATAANQPYLLPSTWLDELTRTITSEISGAQTSPLAELLGIMAAAGLEVLVLDMTRPDVGLPVAKVIVPGLRHFWARLAPGRLYDVPVKLGWLPQPTPEESLNPVAMFL
jgi:ribosomal protein S12 methylthiotransferase accessory factor